MRVGVLVTGDTAVRAAHSLSAHPGIDSVVVIGPARSKSFEVVDDAGDCDLLIGTGPTAPRRAQELGVPLVWDGDGPEAGVAVWGASAQGLTLAIAEREPGTRLAALAHPDIEPGSDHTARFPDPVGLVEVADTTYAGRPLAVGASPNEFAACLAVGEGRRVTIVDHAAFLSGICLAAGAMVRADDVAPVWDNALPYLEAVTKMGLVMAESD